MTAPVADPALASRHASLRWLGVPLFFFGVVLVVLAVIAVVGGAPWTRIPLALLATGLGLAAFGSNNDTALALAMEARRVAPDRLPESLAAELEDELEQDRAAAMNLHPTPKVALVMPVLALALQGWLAWLLLA